VINFIFYIYLYVKESKKEKEKAMQTTVLVKVGLPSRGALNNYGK